MALQTRVNGVIITAPEETISCYPSSDRMYWDLCRHKENGITWYYSTHLTVIMDLLYKAGREKWNVKLKLEGADELEL